MLIEFSDFNPKLLILFIYPIFLKIQDHTKILYLDENKDNFLFRTFRYFTSYIFAFIPLLIIKRRAKNNNKGIINKVKELKEENDEIKNKVLPDKVIISKKRKIMKKKYKNILYLGILCITILCIYI